MSIAQLGGMYIPLFVRALGMFSVLPFPRNILSPSHKVMFAAGLALLGCHEQSLPSMGFQNVHDIILIASEFLIGIILALPIALVVSIAAMYGEFFDVARGQTVATYFNPLNETQEVYTSLLLQNLTVSLLLYGGIGEGLVSSFLTSITLLPHSHVADLALVQVSQRIILLIVTNLGTGLLLSLPFVLYFLVIECVAGLVIKIAPQLSLNNEVASIKTLLGFFLLWSNWQLGIGSAILGMASPSTALRLLSISI